MVFQDCDTLKKGFSKLRDKYTKSTAKVSVLEDELSVSRGESEQLRIQITKLQDELKAQNNALADQVASAASAAAATSRKVCIHVQHP